MSNPNKPNEKKESKGLTFDEIQQIFVERRNNEKATTGDNKEETHLFD